MAGIGPNLRPTALIFQNRALFPLITVWENIAFSLEVRSASKAELAKDRELRRQIRAVPGMFIPKIQKPVTESDVPAPGTEQYKGTFDPRSLQRLGPGGKEQAPAGEAPAESPGAEQYKSIFDPSNLQDLAPGQEGKQEGATKSPGAEQYKSIFDPKNLQQLGSEGDKKQDGATQ